MSGEVSDVAVERNSLLCCSGLTDGQRHAQNGVSTKLSCSQTDQRVRDRSESERQVRERDRQVIERDGQVLTFVLSSIQIQHELVDLLLLDNTEFLERQAESVFETASG